jgi:hypothetical protein
MIVAAHRQQERYKKPELPSSTSDSTPSSTVPDADTQEKPSSSTCSTPQPLEGKEIIIEAKTFCKLGHFNLLLENFPKGISTVTQSKTMKLIVLICYSLVRISKILQFKTRPLEGCAVFVWPGTRILPLQRVPVVSTVFWPYELHIFVIRLVGECIFCFFDCPVC